MSEQAKILQRYLGAFLIAWLITWVLSLTLLGIITTLFVISLGALGGQFFTSEELARLFTGAAQNDLAFTAAYAAAAVLSALGLGPRNSDSESCESVFRLFTRRHGCPSRVRRYERDFQLAGCDDWTDRDARGGTRLAPTPHCNRPDRY